MGFAGLLYQLNLGEGSTVFLPSETQSILRDPKNFIAVPLPASPRRLVNHTHSFPTLERSRELGWKSERPSI